MPRGLTRNGEILRIHAFHEAGHAVVAWTQAIPLGEVKIELNGGLCNHALIVSPSLDPELMSNGDWARVQKRALVLLAGEVTEKIFGEIAEQEGNAELAELYRDAYTIAFESTEPGSDREELREMLQMVFGSLGLKSTEWLSRIENMVEDIIIENWKIICSLAEAILARKVLSGVEATQIIRNS